MLFKGFQRKEDIIKPKMVFLTNTMINDNPLASCLLKRLVPTQSVLQIIAGILEFLTGLFEGLRY